MAQSGAARSPAFVLLLCACLCLRRVRGGGPETDSTIAALLCGCGGREPLTEWVRRVGRGSSFAHRAQIF